MNNILRFRCHRCTRVNEIDLNLCSDSEPLQTECAWCGRYHDEAAIRTTLFGADAEGQALGEQETPRRSN